MKIHYGLVNPSMSQQKGQPRHSDRRHERKQKASKTDSEVTTLTEGNLNDMENIIREATQEAVDEAMSE